MKENFYKKSSASWLGKISLLVVALLFAGMANATNYFWIGGKTGTPDFATASNWSTSYNGNAAATTFTTSDNFTIDGGNLGGGATGALTVKFSTNISVGQIQITGNANVTFSVTGGGTGAAGGGITCTSLDLGTANGSGSSTSGATLNDGGNVINVTGGNGAITGTGTHTSPALTSTTATASLQVAQVQIVSGGTTSGVSQLTVAAGLNIANGQVITGTGIQAGTTVTYSGTTLTLSKTTNASIANSSYLTLAGTFTVPSGLTNIAVGQMVLQAGTGSSGLGSNIFVQSYSGTTLILGSTNSTSNSTIVATTALSNSTIFFMGGIKWSTAANVTMPSSCPTFGNLILDNNQSTNTNYTFTLSNNLTVNGSLFFTKNTSGANNSLTIDDQGKTITIGGNLCMGIGSGTAINTSSVAGGSVILTGSTSTVGGYIGYNNTVLLGNLNLQTTNADVNFYCTVQVKGNIKFDATTNTTGKLILNSGSTLSIGTGSAYNLVVPSITMNGTGAGNVIKASGNVGGITINSSGSAGTFYFDATNRAFAALNLTAGTATFGTTCTFNSTSTLSAATTLTTSPGANISFLANTLNLNGGLLTLGTNSTMLVGTTNIVAATSTSGKGVDASASGAGVTFYGAAASYTLGQYFFANTNVSNFTDSLNSSSQATVFSLNASAAIINVTNFKFANGNTSGLTFTSNGRMTIGSTSISNPGTVTIQKTNTGGLTLTTVPTYFTASGQSYNNVSFTYSGTSPITTGSELPSTIKDLTLTNTGATPSVTLTTSTTVNGTMTLSGGNSGAASNSMLGINDGVTLTMAGGSLIKRTTQNCVISKTGTTGAVAYGGLVDFSYTNSSTFSQTSLEIPSGTSNLGTFTIQAGASIYTLPTGPVTYTINNAANFYGTGGIALNGNTVVMANGSTITRGASGTTTSINSYFTGSGTVKYGTAATHRVNLIIDYTSNTAAAELQIAGANSGGSIGTLTIQNGATYTLPSSKSISIDALVIGAGSTLDMSTNQLQENTANSTTVSINATGVLKSSYVATAANAFFPTASTLKTFGGTVNFAASGMYLAGTYNNLTLAGSANATGNIAVNGTFTTPNTSYTLAMTTYTLLGSTSTTAINCNATTTNTSSTPFFSSKTWGGSVSFNGSGSAQTIPDGTYASLTLNNTSGASIASSSSNVIVNGALTFNGTTPVLTVGNNTLTLQGTVTTSGVGNNIDATATGATVVYNGSVSQTLAANTFKNGNIYNLTVNNSTTSTGATAGALNIATPITVGAAGGGTLTMTQGMVYYTSTGAITIANPSASAIGGGGLGTASYINGLVNWSLASGTNTGTYKFPVGAYSGGDLYFTYTLVNPVLSATSNVGLTVTKPGITITAGGGLTSVTNNEYWTVTTSGGATLGASSVKLAGADATSNNFDAVTFGTSNSSGSTQFSTLGSNSISYPTVSSATSLSATATPLYFAFGTATCSYCITSVVPTAISGVSQSNSTGYYGQEISLIGNGLLSITQLTINNSATIPAASFTYQDNLLIKVIIPATSPNQAALSGTIVATNVSSVAISPAPSFTVSGYISNANTDWNTGTTWMGNNVPFVSGAAVVINNAVTLNGAATLAPVGLTVTGTNSLTFGASGTLSVSSSVNNNATATIDMTSGGTLTLAASTAFTNNGTFTAGTGTVTFSGSGSLLGTTPTFNNLNVGGAITLSGSPTINGNLSYTSTSSSLSQVPIYTSTSTLVYKAQPYTVGTEWGVGTSVGSINMVAAGSYTAAPVVTFGAPTSGVTATGTANLNVVGAITIGTGGSGYSSVPTITINPPASGTTATAVAVLTSGVVSSIIITNQGSGYTSIPTVTISAPTSGTTATATAALGVGSITITNPGSGYTSMPAITFATTNGTGASASAVGALGLGVPQNVTIDIASGSNSTSTAVTTSSVAPSARNVIGTLKVNSGYLLAAGNITVGTNATSGSINIVSGNNLDMAGNTLYGNFTPAGTGTLSTQNGGSSAPPSIPYDLTWLGTVKYNGSGNNQRIMPGIYNNLDASVGGAKNFNNGATNSGIIQINGTFSITDGTNIFVTNNSTVIFNGSNQVIPGVPYNNLTIGASATGTTFGTSASNSLSIVGAFTNLSSSVTGSNQGTINFSGTTGQSIPAFNYYSLTISGAKTTGYAVLASSGTVGIQGTFTNSATYTTGGFVTTGSTVNYNGSSTQTVIATTYNNLIISNRAATVTLASSGTITVLGDFTNNHTGTLTTTGSTLSFASTSVNQNINSTNTFTLNNLTINNTGSGTNVSLNRATSLGTSGVLNLTNGRLTTTSTNSLTLNNTATTAIVSSNSAYIDGPVTWTLPASNSTGTYSIPIGKYVSGNNYYPITLNSPSTGTGTVTITAEAFKTAAGGSADGSTLQSLSTNQYWAITTTGNFTSSSVSLAATAGDVSGFNAIGYSTTKTGTYASYGGSATSNGFNGSSSITGSGFLLFAQLQVASPPTITSVSATTPSSIAGTNAGYSGSSITITGTNFLTTLAVTIGGVAPSTYTVVDDNTITATVAASGVSSGNVTVTNSNGVTPTASFSGFTYYPGLVSVNSTSWSLTSTWLTGVVPTAGTTVTIANAVTLNTAAASPANIIINSGASLSLGTTGAASITVSNSLTNGGTLNIGSASNFASSVTLSGSTSTNSGTINLNVGSTSNALVLNSSLTNSGTFQVLSILQLNNGGTVTGSAVQYGSSSKLYYNTGNTATPGQEWVSGATSLTTGEPQTVTVGLAAIGSTVLSTTVDFGTGRFIVGGLTIPSGFTTSLGSGNTLSTGGGTITGTLNIANTAILTTTGSTTVAGTINIANGGQFSAGNSITVSGGGTLNIGATVLNSASAVSGTDATLIFTNSNLNVSSGGTVNLYGYLKTSPASSVSQSGTMTVAKNAVFEAANPTSAIPTATWDASSYLYITGLVGSPPTNIAQSFGNVIWNCTSMSGVITLASNTFNSINNFYILNTTGFTLRLTNGTNTWGSLQVGGTLSFNGSTISSSTVLLDLCYTASSANTLVTGNVVINNASTVLASQATTLTIRGNFTQGGIFTNTNTTVAFTGTGASNVAVGGSVTNVAFNNLTINKTGTAANAKVTLVAPVTVGSGNTGVLTLTQGRIVTDATNTLTIANTSAGAISGGSITPVAAYVDGALLRTLPASSSTGTYVYPVGTFVSSADNYYPLTLNNPTTGTGTTTVTIQVDKSATGGSADGSSLSAISGNQYWVINSTGSYAGSSVSLAGTAGDLSGFNTVGFSPTKTGSYSSFGGTATSTAVNNSSVVTGSGYLVFATIYVSPPPTITSVSADVPSGQNAGYSGTTLTINGTNLSTVSAVTIGGVAASSFTVLSNTQLTAVVASSGVSSGTVTVTNSNPTTPTATKTGFTYLTGFATKQGGDWSTGSTWLGGVAPSGTTSTVTITNNGAVTLNATATVANLTINSGASLSLGLSAASNLTTTTSLTNDGILTIGISSTPANTNFAFFTFGSGASGINNGTITVNSGSVNNYFLVSGTLVNSGTFNVNGSIQINPNGSITGNGIVYGSSSSLFYNTGNTVNPGAEWKTGNTAIGSPGVPQNVTIGDRRNATQATLNNNTVVSFGTDNLYRALAGNLTISTTTTGAGLQLSSVAGGDLKIAGNFTATQVDANAFKTLPGGFDANGRMVHFISAVANVGQIVTGPSASAITFHYITIGTDATSTNYVALGSDIAITAPNGGDPVTMTAPIAGTTIYYLNANNSSGVTPRNITIGTAGKTISGTVYIRGGGSNPSALTINGASNSTLNLNIDYGGGNSFLSNVTVNSVNVALQSVLTVNGNLVNNGTISGSPVLTLAGAAAQTIDGTGTINNLTLNNAAGVTINSGNQSITGILKVNSGTFNMGTNGLTLKSTSITNTAIVDQVTGIIKGTATVERYIPAGFRAYRDIAPEVYKSTNTIFNTWQESGTMTSGTGIFITGPSATHADDGFYGANAAAAQPSPASSGLDYSINGTASAYTYNNADGTFNWNFGGTTNTYSTGAIPYGIANTSTTTLDPLTGFRILVRGDRSFNLAKTPISNIYNYGLLMVKPTTLRATGQLIAKDVVYNKDGATATAADGSTAISSPSVALNTTFGARSGFSMVANPYVAPVQWTKVYAASVAVSAGGINASYWYLDPTYSATGTYLAYNALSGGSSVTSDATNSYTKASTNATTATDFIQPGQAFFVQSASATPTVKFTEACKAASSANLKSIFGVTAPVSKIYLSLLMKDTANKYAGVDGAALAFRSDFGNTAYGPQDALKFGTSNNSVAISDKGTALSIDGRMPATASDVIPIALRKLTAKSYKLVIDASSYNANSYLPVLKDNYRGIVKVLSIGVDTITFTVDTSIAATYSNRFSLGFKQTTLAVNSIVASASLNNKTASISWNTVGEKRVSRFEVEKSTDAKSFTKIGQATAKNTTTASYSATDNNATAAINYYRIKAISEVGTVSYSNVAKVSISNYESGITLYPNPLKGSKVLNVSLANVSAGKYYVTITNLLGQKVHEAAISHQGGTATHAITVTNTLAAGTYGVTVRDANGQAVYQSNLSVQP